MKEIIEIEKNIRKDLPERFSELDFFKKNFSRIINLFEGNIMPPYEVLIHPSSICNLSCKWCIGSYVAKNRNKVLENSLSKKENMKKVIQGILSYEKQGKDYLNGGIEKYRIENISFSGITGEPLVSKESLKYAIDILKNSGRRVGMFTNGSLVTSSEYNFLANLDYILISLDAGTPQTYSKLKCDNKEKDMFDKIVTNIEGLIRYKKNNNSNIDVNIGYMVNKLNYCELYNVAKKLKEIGIHYLRLKTDISSQIVLNEAENKELKMQIRNIKNDIEDNYFKIIEIHKIGNEEQKYRDFKKCFIHYLYGAISADGRVYPCNYHPKVNGYSYESSIEKKFGDIWDKIQKYEIDKEIPNICPDRCDPFKTRANRLLELAYTIYKNEGIDKLKEYIFNL
ncbi:MAG: radical SAM protein [Clostridia bacterium]|nr:radical SAM protein [Clostridia bacterium]